MDPRSCGTNPVDVTAWTVVMPSDRTTNKSRKAPFRRASLAVKNAHFGRGRIILVAGNEETAKEAEGFGLDVVPNFGPFVMSRAWNLGLAQVKTPYAFLLEDDTRLVTPFGIDELVRVSAELGDSGMLSPCLRGDVLGHKVFAAGAAWEMTEIVPQDFTLVASLLPMSVFEKVGPFDEKFTGYGYDDNDYGLRVTLAELKLRIYQRVVVDHESYLSAYREHANSRTGVGLGKLAFENRLRFVAKHGRRVMKWGGA